MAYSIFDYFGSWKLEMNNFIKRMLTVLVGIPIALCCLTFNESAFSLLTSLQCIALVEYIDICSACNHPLPHPLVIVIYKYRIYNHHHFLIFYDRNMVYISSE